VFELNVGSVFDMKWPWEGSDVPWCFVVVVLV
jgi:hypothetical protein